jgi:hypothetical protein
MDRGGVNCFAGGAEEAGEAAIPRYGHLSASTCPPAQLIACPPVQLIPRRSLGASLGDVDQVAER